MALSISFELISLFIIKFELNVLMKISAMTPKKLGRERERERDGSMYQLFNHLIIVGESSQIKLIK